MSKVQSRALVIGAGPAGLSAACLAAKAGIPTALITGQTKDQEKPHDPRTIALMQCSIRLLEHIGIWPGTLQDIASPLRKLRLIDDTGSLFAAPTVTFSSQEIGADAFGWNIPVEALQDALLTAAKAAGVKLIESAAKSVKHKGALVQVELENGSKMDAQVVIAADGRNSVARRSIGISSLDWSYDQTAIATSFAHTQPHHDTSTEYHKPAGPLTTVPMPDGRSSVVWMERPERAEQLISLPDKDFSRELQLETHGDLGAITSPGPRRVFPMRGLTATRFAANRVVLVGEAAHVVPPIGAQGLNMSLRDAAMIAELIADADGWGEDIGNQKILDAYDQRRRADIAPRQAIIHSMNSSLLSGISGLHNLRAAGIALINKVTPLRQRIMREGLAPTTNLPRVMRV